MTDGDFWSELYQKNLIFLYFGLLIFGLGVGLYNVASPVQIRKYPTVESYIYAMQSIETKNLIIGSFDNVIAMYFANLKGEERSSMFSSVNIGFPGSVSADFHRLIEEVFLEIDPAIIDSFDNGANELGDHLRPFWTDNGYLLTEEIIEVAFSGRALDRVLLYALYDGVAKRPKDIFYIEHKSFEFSKPSARGITFLFFSVGLILTAIPTLLTSIQILRHW